MKSFDGKLAVVTGGGSGMGRELVIQLAAAGCSVAACDLSERTVAETAASATARSPDGTKVTGHTCDISNEAAVAHFRDEVIAQHETRHIDLLFNNAGIFGAGSFLTDDRDAWERVFNVCWFGVYNMCRVFVPLLVASEEGHIVNTSSANALRAVHSRGAPSTAYSAGKWAVRGFTEALIEDLRTHAPHVSVSQVIPGGVVTDMRANSGRILGSNRPGAKVSTGADHLRAYLVGMGVPVKDASEPMIERLMGVMQSDVFAMPVTQAATDILSSVREGSWRVLVGAGIAQLDQAVRANPEAVYDADGPSLINQDMLVGIMTLISRFDPGTDGAVDGSYELRLDPSPIICRVRGAQLELTRKQHGAPDATLETDAGTFRALVLHQEQLDDAVRSGRLRLIGDRNRIERLLGAVSG
jgi:NAD(P)-dependent dehydrogenase (short-subunit alcohol dehydrogenase family)